MDKATKVAVEKYPHGTFDGEIGDSLRAACAVGYMQAEKDLALTWEDVWKLWDIMEEVRNAFYDNPKMFNLKEVNHDTFQKAFGEEVLRRFLEYKNK